MAWIRIPIWLQFGVVLVTVLLVVFPHQTR